MRSCDIQPTVIAVVALAPAVPAAGFAAPGKPAAPHGKRAVQTTGRAAVAEDKTGAKTRTVVYIHIPMGFPPTDPSADPNVCQDTGQLCTDAQLCAFRSENCDSVAALAGDPAALP